VAALEEILDGPVLAALDRRELTARRWLFYDRVVRCAGFWPKTEYGFSTIRRSAVTDANSFEANHSN